MTQLAFPAIVFCAVFLATLLVLMQLIPGAIQSRLRRAAGEGTTGPALGPQWIQRVTKLTGPLTKLSLPSGEWEKSPLRIRFMNAGLRQAAAPALFFASKTLLTFLLPAGALLLLLSGHRAVPANLELTLLASTAAIGYFLPNLVLARLVTNRKNDIFLNFPDALDLVTICVEAGLGLDGAIARVGDEMRLKSAALSEELHLMTLSLRAGGSRERALRELALRTGVEEIDTLAAMLVQADRFGTSIASSLRVHSESLRSKRRQRAEEVAARVPTKMLFPLIFCVFPSLLVVLLGPAFINIYSILLPVLKGQQ